LPTILVSRRYGDFPWIRPWWLYIKFLSNIVPNMASFWLMNRASIDTTYEWTLQFVGGRTVNLPILSLLLDLCMSIEPSEFCIVWKIHLQPTTFWLGLEGSSSHVTFRTRALYSLYMAWRHFGSLRAWADVVGSRSRGLDNWVWRFSFWRGLQMLFLALVWDDSVALQLAGDLWQ
jgi:hypothetical protein